MEVAMRLVSSLAFVLLVGCADSGDEGFFVLANTAPPAGNACTLTSQTSQPSFSSGEITFGVPPIAPATGYVLTPLFQSRITARNTSPEESSLRTIHLEGANISANFAGASGTAQQYSVLFSGSLTPQGNVNAIFEALPVDKIKMFGNATQSVTVVLTVTAFGTLGGGRIDAEPFQYPITITAPGKCTDLAPGTTAVADACNRFQDTLCCVTMTGGLSCPAVAGL
jgi:hypothetical protein